MSVCNIQTALRVAQAIQDYLLKAPGPAGPAEIRQATFADLSKELGQPPSWFQGSWQKTFPRLSAAKALDRLAKKFSGLRFESVWSHPEGRALLLQFQQGKLTPYRFQRELARFFARQGYEDVAVLIEVPYLAFLPRPFGFRAPRASELEQPKAVVTGVEALSPRSRALLEEIRKNPQDWPRLQFLLQQEASRVLSLYNQISAFRQEVEGILARNRVLPSRAPQMSLVELVSYGIQHGGKRVGKELSEAFRRLGLSRVSDDPYEVFFEELLRVAQDDIRARIEELPTVLPKVVHEVWGKSFGALRKFSREYSIARVGYVLMQLLQDGVIKPLFAGYGKVIPHVLLEFRSFARVWGWGLDLGISPAVLREGGFVPRSGLDQELLRHGIQELPEEIIADLERDLNFFELQAFRAEASSLWELPVVGPILRGQVPFVHRDIPLLRSWAKKSKIYPPAWIARFSAAVSVLARAQESATRKAVFGAAFLGRLWDQEYPRFLAELSELGARWNLPFDLGKAVERELPRLGSFRPEDLRSLVETLYLQHLQRQNPVLARQVEVLWQQRIEAALRYGVQEAQRVNYDYLRRTVGDDILSWIFKFHFWASRNLPFYLEEFLRHRALFRFWARVRLTQMEEEAEGERSPRLGQAVRILDDLVLFGAPARLYADVFDLVSVSTQLSLLSEVEGARTGWEGLIRTGGSLTFSPHWDLSVAMWLLGYDLRADPPTLAPPLAGVFRSLGLPGQPGLDTVLGVLRSHLSGHLPGSEKRWSSQTLTGSPGLDRAIWIELIIMSYERTGRPNHPRFVRAFADPDDPLFQEAKARVLGRTRVEQASFFFSPQRVMLEPVSQEELRALRAAVGWEQLSPEERRQLILDDSPAAWTAFIPRDLREAQIRSAEAAQQLDRLENRLQPPSYYAARYPWYGEYLLWQEKVARGDRSISRFLEETR